MVGMTSSALARLAFWAKGMVAISDGRMEWPGFSYTDAEWARMRTLSEPIGAGTYQLFTIVNAVIFITIASLGIFGVFLPLATVLFPVPAETSALKFSLLLAACAFLIIGLGLPISMRLSAVLVASNAVPCGACSRARRRGASVKSVLADQPHHADHVRPAGARHPAVHCL
jgi:hypothetical protein